MSKAKTTTYMQKPADVERQWHIIDAQGQVLGRLATQIASKLIGKHKTTVTPHVDGGDYVVVINAAQIQVTGNKLSDKLYYRHSLRPGGMKIRNLQEMITDFPEEVIRRAVYNMIPKNRLRTGRMNRLKVYAGAEHKHAPQLNTKTTKDSQD